MIAVARIMMPKSLLRLSAGRQYMTDELQALCFFAGANSIFIGDVLLTTKNPQTDRDTNLLGRLGMTSRLDDAAPARSKSRSGPGFKPRFDVDPLRNRDRPEANLGPANKRGTPETPGFYCTCNALGVGDPGMTRTCDLRFRKPSLYPAELRDRTPARVDAGA